MNPPPAKDFRRIRQFNLTRNGSVIPDATDDYNGGEYLGQTKGKR